MVVAGLGVVYGLFDCGLGSGYSEWEEGLGGLWGELLLG